MTATLRVHHALRAAGLRNTEPPERILNAMNEVWAIGDYIVRVNPHPGAHRLQDEARLLLYLPAEVKAPIAVAAGPASWGEWAVTVRIPGQELSGVWAGLTDRGRQRAVTELGQALEALHGVEAPSQVSAGNPDRCPHPLPVSRLLRLLADASDLPGVDRAVFTDAAERLAEVAPFLDDDSSTLIHGDLHLENVLATDDGQITGLLDFEWSRAGPPDLDLDVLLHSLSEPELHHSTAAADGLTRSDFDRFVGWLRKCYPKLFGHPHLADRLWVYRLAYDVQDLVTSNRVLGGGLAGTGPHHPYQRVVRDVRGRSDLGWFLAR